MSDAPIRKATVPAGFHKKDGGQRQPFPSTQLATPQIPQSSKSVEANHNGPLDNLDDVIFLRLPEVKAVTGLSRSSLYALMREKNFPAPVRLGRRTVAWVRSEVRQWAADRVRMSRSVA